MSEVTTTSAVSSTPAIEPVAVNSGDSPITFDELDAIESRHKEAKKSQKDETKQVVKETVKALDKAKDGDKDEDSKTSKAEDKEAKESEKKDSKKAGEKEEKGKLGASEDQKAKEKQLLKAKLGEKEIDLDPDVIVPVKVNGKDELISLKDLQSQYSGKVSWTQKFSEMDKERRTFHQKADQINTKIKSIMEEKDPEMRFFHMAEFAGADPVEVRNKFLSENMELLEKWYSMSEDERKASNKDFENKVLKYKLESKTKEDSQRQTHEALDAKISTLGKTHQFDSETFWNFYDGLTDLKKEGRLTDPKTGQPVKITPEFVTEHIVKDRLWNSGKSVLDSTDMPQDRKSQALIDLVDIAYFQGLTPEDTKQLAQDMWGKANKTKMIAEKVDEQEELRTGKKAKEKPEYKADKEAFFFNDIL